MHHMASEMLRAVLENDFHHDALQLALDAADRWIKDNPERANETARTIFEELGVGGLARGASWIGIDVQQKVINTFMDKIVILRDAIKKDLERKDSGMASNIKGILLRMGNQLQNNQRVRQALNQEIEEAAVVFASDYADAIIVYVSQQIHDWDTSEMITKIETEVGGDLHMIRVNGVVVGAAIGLILGMGRALIGHIPF